MVASKDCADYETLLDVISVLEDTGLRKAEIVLNAKEDPLITLTWGDVAWRLDNKVSLFPSKSDLRRARKGLIKASLLITPVNSKCDYTGETWGNKPIPIPYDSDPSNAVHRISRRWTRLGVGRMSLAERKRTPVFTDVRTGQAYAPARMDALHNALLKYACGQLGEPQLAKLFSVHSYRIGLATRLRSAGARDSRIQAYCRWLCPESLHIYARWDYDEYEKWIRKARTRPVQVGETRNLPALSNAEDLKAAQTLLARKKKLKAPTKVDQLGVANGDDISEAPQTAAKKSSKASKPASNPALTAVGKSPASKLPVIRKAPTPPAVPCDCGGSDRAFDKPLPAGFMAAWRHAKRRCYWHFVHPTHGGFHSFKQLAPFAARQPPESLPDKAAANGKSPPSSAPVGRKASRKRKRHEAPEPLVVHRSPSPQIAAASPTPTELETETLATGPALPASVALAPRETLAFAAQDPLVAEPVHAPTREDATCLCKCVREVDGALRQCRCQVERIDEGWCEDCFIGGLCECECIACGWVPPDQQALVHPVPIVLPDLPPMRRELRNLQPSTGVRVAARGEWPEYDFTLSTQRGKLRATAKDLQTFR